MFDDRMGAGLSDWRSPACDADAGAAGSASQHSLGTALAGICDELAFALAIVNRGRGVVYANLTARKRLGETCALMIDGAALRARRPSDAAVLRRCIEAAHDGRRQWHAFGSDQRALHVAFLPLPGAADVGAAAAALVFERFNLCNNISGHFFARTCGLTATEERVLAHLSSGLDVAAVAAVMCMRVSTARTHMRSVLRKTGHRSMRTLLLQIGKLPPVASRHEVLAQAGDDLAAGHGLCVPGGTPGKPGMAV